MSDSNKKQRMKKCCEMAKEQVVQKDYATGEVGCGTGLAGKICRHNRKKLNRFVAIKAAKMKKSIDFKDTTVSVDTKDQLLAEKTASPKLIEYIKNSAVMLKAGPGSAVKIPFPTGTLTLSEREAGVYHGHFQDKDGQVVEKFDSQTIEIIAKNLELKSLVADNPDSPAAPIENASDVALSQAHERIDVAHNRIDNLQKQLIEQQKATKGIRIKYGDFELEIKKSVRDFVSDYKQGIQADKDVVRKAISSWRKKQSSYMHLATDQAAARELIENWDAHQESFCQFVDALSRGQDDEQR